MPAYSDEFPWPSHYGEFQFFEQRMRAHDQVRDLETMHDGRYRLIKRDGTTLEIFICECYSFGTAEYVETTAKLGRLHAIIINSNWCGYTDEAKIECREGRVGLFTIGQFMAALNRPDYWNYVDQWQEKRLAKQGLV